MSLEIQNALAGRHGPSGRLLAALFTCAALAWAQAPSGGSAGSTSGTIATSLASSATASANPTASADSAGDDQGAASSTASTESAVPIVTGWGAFIPTWQGGQATLVTIVAPVVLVPIGQNWLVESRAEFEGDFTRGPNGGGFGGAIDKSVDYAQLDYIANRYITISAGRYLTPFGIFNERLYPNWIRNLQTDPLILPLSTQSSDGAMLRGGFAVTKGANLNYVTYFSAESTTNKLESERMFGSRVGVFFTGPRMEVGASFQHLLQDARFNQAGMHLEWQPRALPLDWRAEYAYTENGKGYWLEAAYRLSQAGFWRKELSRTQLVARMQQFFLGKTGAAGASALGAPDSDTARFEVGANYFLRDGLKAIASYGRNFSLVDGNSNLWTLGIAYRFAFPLGRGQ